VHGAILVYGNDSMLVRTRRLILSKAGYDVLTATGFADAMLILVNQPIDLLMLCQTLTDEERRGILETAHALNPEIKTAVLRHEGLDLPVESGEIVEGLDGPASLLGAIGRILHHKARSQPTVKG
jgi:DNA-binding NtrC family response regulator